MALGENISNLPNPGEQANNPDPKDFMTKDGGFDINAFLASIPTVDSLTETPLNEKQNSEREPFSDPLIVQATKKVYELFSAQSFIYPGCGEDNSLTTALRGTDATITYLDRDATAIQIQQKAIDKANKEEGIQPFVQAISSDVLSFSPETLFDALVLINPEIRSPEQTLQIAEQTVKDGGVVICNNYHGTARHLLQRPDQYQVTAIFTDDTEQIETGANLHASDFKVEQNEQGINVITLPNQKGEYKPIRLDDLVVFEKRAILLNSSLFY